MACLSYRSQMRRDVSHPVPPPSVLASGPPCDQATGAPRTEGHARPFADDGDDAEVEADADPGEADHAPGEGRRLTLKEMVRGADTTPRAIRFYEEQGLIATAGRSPGGHRLFAASELPKLKMIIELRTCGFSLEEIREILSAKAGHGSVREAAASIQTILARHVDELQRKIATIQRLGREFTTSIHLLDRCLHCTDPRGAAACHTCDLPLDAMTPRSFRHIWASDTCPTPRKAGSDGDLASAAPFIDKEI